MTRTFKLGKHRCAVVNVGSRHDYPRPFGTVAVKRWPADVRSVFVGRRLTFVLIRRWH